MLSRLRNVAIHSYIEKKKAVFFTKRLKGLIAHHMDHFYDIYFFIFL